jgi:hypothetical protein
VDWVVVYLSRDGQGRTADQAGGLEALCPPEAQWLGAESFAAACAVKDHRNTVRLLADDAIPPELRTCPDGWTHLGGVHVHEVCVSVDRSAVIVNTDVNGQRSPAIRRRSVPPAPPSWPGPS